MFKKETICRPKIQLAVDQEEQILTIVDENPGTKHSRVVGTSNYIHLT